MTVHELPSPNVVIWLTLKQAAERVNFHPRTLRRAMDAGELEFSGGGGYAIRIRLDKLDEWAENRGRRDDGG